MPNEPKTIKSQKMAQNTIKLWTVRAKTLPFETYQLSQLVPKFMDLHPDQLPSRLMILWLALSPNETKWLKFDRKSLQTATTMAPTPITIETMNYIVSKINDRT